MPLLIGLPGAKKELETVMCRSVGRLLKIAYRNTGQSKKVADFLLAWYNAQENGGWDPADLWGVDAEIAADMMTVLGLIHCGPQGKYPSDWGFRKEIERVWELWRSPDPPSAEARAKKGPQ